MYLDPEEPTFLDEGPDILDYRVSDLEPQQLLVGSSPEARCWAFSETGLTGLQVREVS